MTAAWWSSSRETLVHDVNIHRYQQISTAPPLPTYQLQLRALRGREPLGGCSPVEHPPGPMVEFLGDLVEVVLSKRRQVSILVQVLTQETVRVLVGPALPRMISSANVST